MTTPSHALVLFAHGARDPQWAEPFERIRDRISGSHPEAIVRLAFLELMKPSLNAAIDDLVAHEITRITLVPLFMAQGGHLKEDLPKLIAAIGDKYPSLAIKVTPAIGEVEAILAAIAEWAEAAFIAGNAD